MTSLSEQETTHQRLVHNSRKMIEEVFLLTVYRVKRSEESAACEGL